jgi:hypothetical protein
LWLRKFQESLGVYVEAELVRLNVGRMQNLEISCHRNISTELLPATMVDLIHTPCPGIKTDCDEF